MPDIYVRRQLTPSPAGIPRYPAKVPERAGAQVRSGADQGCTAARHDGDRLPGKQLLRRKVIITRTVILGADLNNELLCFQTVDFLYEDNGGRPKDLTLPTLDDIKEDLAKFTIGRLIHQNFQTSIKRLPNNNI